MIIVEALKTNKNPPNKGKKEAALPWGIPQMFLLTVFFPLTLISPLFSHTPDGIIWLSALRDRNTDN